MEVVKGVMGWRPQESLLQRVEDRTSLSQRKTTDLEGVHLADWPYPTGTNLNNGAVYHGEVVPSLNVNINKWGEICIWLEVSYEPIGVTAGIFNGKMSLDCVTQDEGDRCHWVTVE